jgi:hypothetical protein
MLNTQQTRFRFSEKAISFLIVLLVTTLLLPTSLSLLGEITGEGQHILIEKALDEKEERNDGQEQESLEDYKVEKLSHTPSSNSLLSDYLSFTRTTLASRYRPAYLEIITPPPEV